MDTMDMLALLTILTLWDAGDLGTAQLWSRVVLLILGSVHLVHVEVTVVSPARRYVLLVLLQIRVPKPAVRAAANLAKLPLNLLTLLVLP